jgi:hypothetical protein
MLDRPVLYGGVRHILLTRTSRAGGRHAGLRTGPGRRGGVRLSCARNRPRPSTTVSTDSSGPCRRPDEDTTPRPSCSRYVQPRRLPRRPARPLRSRPPRFTVPRGGASAGGCLVSRARAVWPISRGTRTRPRLTVGASLRAARDWIRPRWPVMRGAALFGGLVPAAGFDQPRRPAPGRSPALGRHHLL